jgi:hypothetical protein
LKYLEQAWPPSRAVAQELRASNTTVAVHISSAQFGKNGKGYLCAIYYDRDADVNLIKGKKIAVVGYGS